MFLINTRKKKFLLWTWILSAVITFLLGGGFATRYVLALGEDEFIAYKEELNSIKSINVLEKEDGYTLSICFNALLAYTLENNNYQIDSFFKTDFTGWGTRAVPREHIKVGCSKTKGAIDLFRDARSNKENDIEPYYKLNGTYCRPGTSSAMLTFGCFMNPKQKWGRVEVALSAPEHQYKDNSEYTLILPIAWISDVVLAPIHVIYTVSIYVIYLLWAIGGGGIPGMP